MLLPCLLHRGTEEALGSLDERALRNAKDEHSPLANVWKRQAAGKGCSEKDSTDDSCSRNTQQGAENTGGKEKAGVGTACYCSLMQQTQNISALYQKENN